VAADSTAAAVRKAEQIPPWDRNCTASLDHCAPGADTAARTAAGHHRGRTDPRTPRPLPAESVGRELDRLGARDVVCNIRTS